MEHIKAEDFSNAFDKIGKQWMLVAAKDGEKVNAMTASWGGIGVMWGKNVAFIFVRQTRYTKELIDKTNTLSISFFDEKYRNMLGYMGRVSGRDEDKIKTAGLNVINNQSEDLTDAAPVFQEAEETLLCRKLYAGPVSLDDITDKSLVDKWYGDGNYHTMYVVEITDVLKK